MTAADILNLVPVAVLAHAPALLVVTPLLTAALCAITPSGRVAWLITLATVSFSALMAVALNAQVMTSGVISYDLGGWAPPWGIEYRVDPLNAFVLGLVSLIGLVCVIYAPGSVGSEIDPRKHALFYSAFLVCFAGLLGVTITGDAFNIFVFLEISSLSTYVLVAMGAERDRRALTAAYNYLVLGTIGATFFVIGVGFLYIATGTLNLVDMGARLADQGDNRVVQAGFAFVIVGMGLKIAMYPLHTWLPNAYAFAPNFVTAFLAATATKVSFYVLVRFEAGMFGPQFEFTGLSLMWVFAPLAVVGMMFGSMNAVFENNIRRLFAYSSVAQVGYMLLGVSFGTAAGLASGLLHLMNHALMKGAIFMALGMLAMRLGVTRVSDLAGLGRVMPFTMFGLVIASASLIGVPLTAGFVSKFYLLTATLERGWVWAAAAIAISSVLAFVYVGRLIEAAYLRAAPTHDGRVLRVPSPPLGMVAALWVLAIANIWFGVDSSLTTSLACRAALFVTPGATACLTDGVTP